MAPVLWSELNETPLRLRSTEITCFVSVTAENPCELNCMPRGENFFYRHSSAVVDGTPCHPGRRDICVEGVCKVSLKPELNLKMFSFNDTKHGFSAE